MRSTEELSFCSGGPPTWWSGKNIRMNGEAGNGSLPDREESLNAIRAERGQVHAIMYARHCYIVCSYVVDVVERKQEATSL
jgi:hypothetical protein